MTPTELFYEDIFVEEIDFTAIVETEDMPPLQKVTVPLASPWMKVAAATFAGFLTIGASALPPSAFSLPATAQEMADWFRPPQGPRLVAPGEMSDAHQAKAERVARLFRQVPLNDVEKLPDPDYGL